MRKSRQTGGKYRAVSIDTSNGKQQLLGMAGRGFANVNKHMPPPFYTMPVRMKGQGGGSSALYISRKGQFGGQAVRYGRIWSG